MLLFFVEVAQQRVRLRRNRDVFTAGTVLPTGEPKMYVNASNNKQAGGFLETGVASDFPSCIANNGLDQIRIHLWHAFTFLSTMRNHARKCQKAPDEGPLSLVEAIARDRVPAFTRKTARARVLTTVEMPDGEPTTGLRAAMDKARKILPHLPAENLGRLQLDSRGRPVPDPNRDPTGEGSLVVPKLGGAMLSFEGLDRRRSGTRLPNTDRKVPAMRASRSLPGKRRTGPTATTTLISGLDEVHEALTLTTSSDRRNQCLGARWHLRT